MKTQINSTNLVEAVKNLSSEQLLELHEGHKFAHLRNDYNVGRFCIAETHVISVPELKETRKRTGEEIASVQPGKAEGTQNPYVYTDFLLHASGVLLIVTNYLDDTGAGQKAYHELVSL